MSDKSMTWAAHCDTDVRFFSTEDEAWGWANEQLAIFRRERSDGWDEDGAEAIVVMRVVSRAQKVDANAPYQAVDYSIRPLPDSLPLPAPEMSEDDKDVFHADAAEHFPEHLLWCFTSWILDNAQVSGPVANLPTRDFVEYCREKTIEYLNCKRGPDNKSYLERREAILKKRSAPAPTEPTDDPLGELLGLLVRVGKGEIWDSQFVSASHRLLPAISERLKQTQFRPMGDNHHNAAACPYCNPKWHELQEEVAVLKSENERLKGDWRAQSKTWASQHAAQKEEITALKSQLAEARRECERLRAAIQNDSRRGGNQ